jgi:hypothetical protein
VAAAGALGSGVQNSIFAANKVCLYSEVLGAAKLNSVRLSPSSESLPIAAATQVYSPSLPQYWKISQISAMTKH